jgi:hypothetical protein
MNFHKVYLHLPLLQNVLLVYDSCTGSFIVTFTYTYIVPWFGSSPPLFSLYLSFRNIPPCETVSMCIFNDASSSL